MEIQQLKYFLGVVEHKHFTTAATELCVSQSSLSKHIKSLEDELQVKLLDRSAKSVKVMEAGSDFYTYAAQTV